jgi:branched-chain amino acid transport system ATP-binding protein
MSEQTLETGSSRSDSNSEALLVVDNVTLRFGGVVALDQVAFEIKKGEILGLIGPNGAGKTTCFNVMTGVYTPTSGDIRFDGSKISGGKPHRINALGIARTFQNIRLFPEMTAMENVMVGADARHKTSVMGVLFRLYRVRAKEHELPDNPVARSLAKVFGISRHTLEERAGRRKAMTMLRFVGIADRAHELARNLPYGYQRRLEIARALATEPKLLCLDEPTAGMSAAETHDTMQLVRRIARDDLTILIVEHDMHVVMELANRITVLHYGEILAEGPPAEIQQNPRVQEVYLKT